MILYVKLVRASLDSRPIYDSKLQILLLLTKLRKSAALEGRKSDGLALEGPSNRTLTTNCRETACLATSQAAPLIVKLRRAHETSD